MRYILNWWGGLPAGIRSLLLVVSLPYLVASALGLQDWLILLPASVIAGEIWRLVSYVLLPMSTIDWLVGLLAITQLLTILTRFWPSWDIWSYSFLCALGGGCACMAANFFWPTMAVGNSSLVMGLMLAWCKLAGEERVVFMGLGELAVAQLCAGMMALWLLLAWFSGGLAALLPGLGGAVAGWLYLIARWKLNHHGRGRWMASERIGRLEL
jgi:membrane associated rhomboid family serine protease